MFLFTLKKKEFLKEVLNVVFASLRQAKLDQERREKEKREKEEEEARQRRLLEEQKARQREEEEREAQARLRAAQEKAQEEERRRRLEEEEEAKRKRADEERKQKEEEEKKRSMKEEQDRGGQQLGLVAHRSSKLSMYRALYSFVARNADELSIDAGGLIEVAHIFTHPPSLHNGWLSVFFITLYSPFRLMNC